MTKIVKKQLKFVEFLKSKSIYNPMVSASTMRNLQELWEVMSKKDRYDGKLVTLINYKYIADNIVFKIVKLKNGYICLEYNTPKLIKNLGNISLSNKEKLDEMFSNKEMKFTK